MINKEYRRFWMQGLLNAIEELHKCKIAHFDIRLTNICYKSDLTPVLIDVDRSVNECDFQDVVEFQMLKKKYNSLLYALEEYHNVPTDIYRIDYMRP